MFTSSLPEDSYFKSSNTYSEIRQLLINCSVSSAKRHFFVTEAISRKMHISCNLFLLSNKK